jgi:rubrerythrin
MTTQKGRAVGRLPGGELYFAPLGEMRSDGERVQCHLCGRWFKMVGGSHLLAAHGWATSEYRTAFRLNATASTIGPVTRDRKRDSMLDQIDRGERTYPIDARGLRTAIEWRSLAIRKPDVAADWHPKRNRALERQGVDTRTVGVKSTIEVWWRCHNCGHVWRSAIRLRCAGAGCPACHAHEMYDRSLATRYPELAAEWHPTRNAGLDVRMIGHASQRRVWWRCKQCGHEWRTTVKHRAYRGQGCPECSKRRLSELALSLEYWRVPRDRSFALQHPELLPQWHPDRNQGLDPFAVGSGSNLKVWWRCTECGFGWQSRPAHRVESRGCRRCSLKRSPGA